MKYSLKKYWLFIFFVICTLSLFAQVGKPRLMVSISPKKVIVGQPVKVKVSVIVPTWLLGAPEFPTLDIPGAIALLPDEQAENITKKIDGETWSGIARTYYIYPQEAKEYELPNESILVVYSVGGIKKSPKTKVNLPPHKFSAVIPSEAKHLEYFLATPKLTIKQEFNRKLSNLKVGDSFSRTIKIEVENTMAMFIPPIEFDSLNGIAIYQSPPLVENKSENRIGFTGGYRIEKTTYYIQKPGEYELPEIEIKWWNLNRRIISTSKIKAVKFTADSNSNYVSELAIPEDSTFISQKKNESGYHTWKYLLYALVTLLLVFMELRFKFIHSNLRRVKNWFSKRKEIKLESEKEYFNNFKRACRGNDLHRIRIEFSNWLNRISKNENWNNVKELSEITTNNELFLNVQKLDDILFGKNNKEINWDKSDFLQQVISSRKEFLKIKKMKAKARLIPPLNP